jgi:PAS domain S-box-containing protein
MATIDPIRPPSDGGDRSADAAFWDIYEQHFEEIGEETAKLACADPQFGPPLRKLFHPGWSGELERTLLELKAARAGDWRAHQATLERSGLEYARQGLSFACWSSLILAFQEVMAPRLVRALAHDPERLVGALSGMHAFAGRTLSILGEAFLNAKERSTNEARDALQQQELKLHEQAERVRTLETQAMLHERDEKLLQTNRFLDSLVETLPVMLFVKDADSLKFVRFNKAGEDLLGWKREDLIGKSDFDFFPAEQAEGFVRKDREVLARGRAETIVEESVLTTTGPRYLLTRKVPVTDEAGRPLYLLGVSQDVTELRQIRLQVQDANAELEELNRRLEQQNEELQRVNRAKSDFLAMMSHELRTPLNSIIGFSEVLIDGTFGPVNDRQVRYLKNVHGSGRHLLGLINDLLDLSKIEAGRLDIDRQSCSPRVLVAEAVGTLQPLADARGLVIEMDHPDATPVPPVQGDSARIKQVLYNLLSNAIKFSPEGGRISISCNELPGEGFVRLSVRDHGPGISAEDGKRLFTPFTQLEGGRAREGTGLGLALTRRLVELMGGRITLESTLGVGSIFHADLPSAPASAPASLATDSRPDHPELAVLIVEDEPAARELLQVLLEEHGYRPLVASNGEDALTLARTTHPSVITLDVGLPTIDGWDLLRILKSDPATNDIPVVMITISDDRKKAFGLGAVEHLIKPVERAELLAALQRRSFTTRVRQRPLHILAIDDDPAHLELVDATLTPQGFVVRTALNGRSGLASARQGQLDLILLDLVLPDLSGIEVVAELRGDERTRLVPILLVTSHDLAPADRQRLNGDIEAVLAKASGTEALIDEIQRVVRRRS